MLAWVATGLSIGGAALVAVGNVWGFAAWIVSNLIWLEVSIKRSDWPQAVLWAVYLVLAGVGLIYNW